MKLTIDASVFVAAARPAEANFDASRTFLWEIQRLQYQVICPALILPECGAAIARRTDDPSLAEKIVLSIECWPGIQIIPTDTNSAKRAAEIAAQHRLRGADAIYFAVSEAFAASLVTWDHEMLQRGPSLAAPVTPSEWLRSNSNRIQNP